MLTILQRCSGEKPKCTMCVKYNKECEYGLGTKNAKFQALENRIGKISFPDLSVGLRANVIQPNSPITSRLVKQHLQIPHHNNSHQTSIPHPPPPTISLSPFPRLSLMTIPLQYPLTHTTQSSMVPIHTSTSPPTTSPLPTCRQIFLRSKIPFRTL